MADILVDSDRDAVPLLPLTKAALPAWLEAQEPATAAWVRAQGFAAAPGRAALLPGEGGRLGQVLLGVPAERELWAYGGLPTTLPEGAYRIAAELDARSAGDAALAWALGGYQFTRYLKPERAPARLVWPEAADRAAVGRAVAAATLVRDLVNTPANDLGPAELAEAAREVASSFSASVEVIEGDDLLDRDYPAIHAVGRASTRRPRLIDLNWGRADAPRVTLVGKGVCFDSGGLDIKPSAAMLTMKKDMGGAAHALGLARMVMAANLPVRLRVLIPAVENAISGASFRPLDVLRTRKGLTVEVGNTDAEGRLILADALAEASAERPALIVDFATLTGAARVALGPDLPALFCNDDATATDLLDAARRTQDPLWRLPLWQPYAKQLKSGVADLNNIGESPFNGAITAALFLERFVGAEIPWVHLDLFAWNAVDRPGRPKGGEAMTMRAVFDLIARRFGGGSANDA